MEISICKLLRILVSLLVIRASSGTQWSPCVTDTAKGYAGQWIPTIIRITRTCGENDKVTLPMDPPEDTPSCIKCTNILKVLQIQGNSVPPSSFENYNTTTILYLENLGIERISPGAFVSMDYLEHLSLKGNQLNNIPVGVLDSIENLKTIDLSMNRIYSMKDVHLEGTIQITSVNLSSNFLTNFETNADWENVTNLALSNNKIKNVNSKELPLNLNILNMNSNSLTNFDIHKNFTELDLSDNSIITINLSWANSTVDRLNLRNNKITNIFGTYCQIKKINLSGNKLNSVPSDCSHKAPQVEFLDLSNNLISNVMPQTVSELTNLKELHLEYNQIKIIKTGTFSSLQKLIYLNISHNAIEKFQMGSVDNIKNVDTFDVSYNNLKSLPRYIMHSFPNLKHLNLEFNNITFLNGTTLNDALPNIWDINIVGNNLSCHNLWDIMRIFNKRSVHFARGPLKNVSNVHGMACYFLANTTEDDIGTSLNELDVNKGIADYFSNDYRESNFYKFLEEIKDTNILVFNETSKIKEEIQKISEPHNKPEKLNASNSSGLNGYLITVLIFLMAITCFIGFQALVLYNKFRTRSNDSERLL